jgi:hypothetical protein
MSGNGQELKEYHINSVREMSKLKDWVDSNMREIKLRKEAFHRVEKEAANIIKI